MAEDHQMIIREVAVCLKTPIGGGKHEKENMVEGSMDLGLVVCDSLGRMFQWCRGI